MTKQEAYKILKIQAPTDSVAIKKAYRKQALKYHPDKNRDTNSQDIFISIVEAYEFLQTLKDPSKLNKKNNNFKGTKFRSIHHKFRENNTAPSYSHQERYEYAKRKFEESEKKIYSNALNEYQSGIKRKITKAMALIGIALSLLFILDYFLPHKTKTATFKQIEFEKQIDPYSQEYFFNIDNQTFHIDKKTYFRLRTKKTKIKLTQTALFHEIIQLGFITASNRVTTVVDNSSIQNTFPLIIILLLIPLISLFFEQANIYFLLFVVNYNLYVFPVVVIILLFHDFRIFRLLNYIF